MSLFFFEQEFKDYLTLKKKSIYNIDNIFIFKNFMNNWYGYGKDTIYQNARNK
jgi:hypothetical protein